MTAELANTETTFKFIDLCAGIGGLRLPFESQNSSSRSKISRLGGQCVWTSEMDEDACLVYAKNFSPDKSQQGIASYMSRINRDFTKFPAREVPDHDLLLAGFPCQPFSQAGKRKGRQDERGRVFDAIEGIIAAKQPKVVLLENVKGLRSMKNPDGTLVLNEILMAMRKPIRGDTGSRPRAIVGNGLLEYFVAQPVVLNARDFGLAQNRQRLFLLAIRKDIAEKSGIKNETDFSWPTSTVDRDDLVVSTFLDSDVPESFTISPKLWRSHKERKQRNKEAGKGFGYQAFKPTDKYVSTISARYFKDGAEALILQGRKPPRKLTPREGARLQGFPEHFILHESNMKAFRQIGNAVPVNVVSAIADKIWEKGLFN